MPGIVLTSSSQTVPSGSTMVSARDIPRHPSVLCAETASRWHSSRAASLTRAGMM